MTFVGEEASHDCETIAHQVCGTSVEYANIDMTKEQRLQLGIPVGYNERDFKPEQKRKWNREREEFMVDRIEFNVQKYSVANAIVICGGGHSVELEALLSKAGYEVDREELQDQGWYDAPKWDQLVEQGPGYA